MAPFGPAIGRVRLSGWNRAIEKLGQEPERTTVTQRIRRIFTWSEIQYREMLRANKPDAVFLNFVNYLPPDSIKEFVESKIVIPYVEEIGRKLDFVLLGSGPYNESVYLYDGL